MRNIALIVMILLAEGSVRADITGPFHWKNVTLASFAQDYMKITGKHLETAGPLEEELKGRVNLTLAGKESLTEDELTEIFFQTLAQNGFTVTDAQDGRSWAIKRTRDARDGQTPIFFSPAGSEKVPDTYRLITVIHTLQYADAEEIARTLRSFTPANARIIPMTSKRVALTDTGNDINGVLKIVALLDVPEAAKAREESLKEKDSSKKCNPQHERHIDRMVIENLEIRNGSNLPGGMTPPSGSQMGTPGTILKKGMSR